MQKMVENPRFRRLQENESITYCTFSGSWNLRGDRSSRPPAI